MVFSTSCYEAGINISFLPLQLMRMYGLADSKPERSLVVGKSES